MRPRHLFRWALLTVAINIISGCSPDFGSSASAGHIGDRAEAVRALEDASTTSPNEPQGAAPAHLHGSAIAESEVARELIERLRARSRNPARGRTDAIEAYTAILPASKARQILRDGAWLRPELPPLPRENGRAEVLWPARFTDAFKLRDIDSGMSVSVRTKGALDVDAEVADGYVVYRGARESSTDVVHVPAHDGTEDYVVFQKAPSVSELVYDVTLDDQVAGLRLVDNNLEFLDKGGAPRLRVSSPYVIDAEGETHDATLTVSGCAYDRDPRPPWGRAPVTPDATQCAVHVTWPKDAAYPLLVDPLWTGTQDLGFRPSFFISLNDGRVLGGGGGANKIYDGTTASWATAASGGGGTAVLLGDGRVLTFTNNCNKAVAIFSPATGLWTTAPSTVAQRGPGAPGTLLGSGLILITPGGACANDANAVYAELYDIASGGTLYDTTHAITGQGSSTLLASGKVLVAGGGVDPNPYTAAAWIYDPASPTWISAPSMPIVRSHHRAIRMSNGKVMLVGGGIGNAIYISPVFFDPAGAGSWSPGVFTQGPSELGIDPGVTSFGADVVYANRTQAYRYDPATSLRYDLAPMVFTHGSMVAATLGTGGVLVADRGTGSVGSAQTEVFMPLANGTACGNAGVCASKVCRSGVCCATACNGACQACSAATKQSGTGDGTCGPAKSGTDPGNFCTDQGAMTCGTNGSCNASGACGFYPTGTACAATTCSSGVQVGTTCNGSGLCNVNTPVACTPYVCSGNACAGTCAGDTGCIAAAWCQVSDGTCQPDQPDGSACTAGSQCTSGACVDGVCCDQPCGGACQACTAAKKGSGSDGTCGNIRAGTDPDNECPDDGAGTCKRDGACSGSASCELYVPGTSCGVTSCSLGVQTGFACNGLGTCNPSTTSNCSPYLCANTSSCASSCADDTGCIAADYCRTSDHTCQSDQPKASVCTLSSQCQSGNCVDGYCCDSPCGGTCQACSATKTNATNGTCAPVKKTTDPDGECPDDGASSCGRDGTCDGIGACQKYANGTACGTTTCSAGTQAGYACDGAGTCKQAQTTACTPYLCNSTACGMSCAMDTDCVASAFCDVTSHCVSDLKVGDACARDSQCTSGHCADGVCCDQACSGACQACSATKKGTGTNGTCGNVAANTDPDDDCSPDSPASCGKNGNCDGQGACKLYQLGTACGAAQCSGATLTGLQCNGLGKCVPGQTSQCDPYVCLGQSNCGQSCADDTGCVSSSFCAGTGTCQSKKDSGTSCSAAHECKSGFCVEQVCCDTACNGTCQACTAANKASGADGACGSAKAGVDPHNDCADEGAVSCKHDGTCDGSGACRVYQNGAACGTTNCENNTQTGHACDGIGVCQPNATVDCGLYVCSGGACTTKCKDSGDCATNAYCDMGDATCKKKTPNGVLCMLPETCSSGFCVDGNCCDQACGGQCQACDVATAKGTCSPVVGAPHGDHPKCDAATGGEICGARACDGAKSTYTCVGYVGADVSCLGGSCSDGIETFTATCDGTGQCGPGGPAKTKRCEPYVCKGESCGSAPCATDADCAPKFRCDATKKDCVPRDVASCNGDHTVSNPDGTTSECAPYKCEGTGCKMTCSSVDECVSGFVCDSSQKCVATPTEGSSDSGSCGCRVPAQSPRSGVSMLMLVAGWIGLRVRRRLRLRGVHQAVQPPSTTSVAPVMYSDALLARKTRAPR